VAQPGASLYNSYHLVTQISGLYAAAAGYDPDPAAAVIWRELCDSAIGDLGEIYLTWDLSLAEARAGRPITVDLAVGRAVARACQRVNRLINGLNVWTPMSRWVNVLDLCERRWQRLLDAFEASSPIVRAKFAPVRTGGKDRLSRLVGLRVRYQPPAPPPKSEDSGFEIVTDDDVFGGKVGA
jgi:hypothetical protein